MPPTMTEAQLHSGGRYTLTWARKVSLSSSTQECRRSPQTSCIFAANFAAACAYFWIRLVDVSRCNDHAHCTHYGHAGPLAGVRIEGQPAPPENVTQVWNWRFAAETGAARASRIFAHALVSDRPGLTRHRQAWVPGWNEVLLGRDLVLSLAAALLCSPEVVLTQMYRHAGEIRYASNLLAVRDITAYALLAIIDATVSMQAASRQSLQTSHAEALHGLPCARRADASPRAAVR